MKYQVAPTDKPIASNSATTIKMISLSLPLVAGSFTAASLFAMPIIRHYSVFTVARLGKSKCYARSKRSQPAAAPTSDCVHPVGAAEGCDLLGGAANYQA